MRLRRRTERPPRRRRIRKLRLLALLLVLGLLLSGAFTYGMLTAVAAEIQQLDPSKRSARREVNSVIEAADGRVLAVLAGDESRVLVGTDRIAPLLKQAVVAVEDRRFYDHKGVDLRGIARALWQDLRRQKTLQGGSTITQQLVKNQYLRNEKTIARKVREAALAYQLEQRWSKDRILTAYLNTIYFGNGAYGVQQAAKTYFRKGAAKLTLAEAALLAGLPRDPARYDPVQHPAAAAARRAFVLSRLVVDGKVTQSEATRAGGEPLPRPEDIGLPREGVLAPYFVNYVTDQLVATLGADRVFGNGLRVRTTIDLELQDVARKAIETTLDDPDGPAAALVAIDLRPGYEGRVRVMFGGTNFRKSQFNLAAQAARQPGSSFKPIVLATAFRSGIAPQTELTSKPVDIDAGDRVWRVTNYESAYLGRASLARAMTSSDNAVYAQLTQLVGPRQIVATAKDLGVLSELPAYFSIGLGAVAVNPLDMARAYATIANDGQRVDGSLSGNRPFVVQRVEFRKSGKTRINLPVSHRALPPAQAQELTAILETVVRLGTGRRAALEGRVAAGKTGTTDDYGDAWFVGYTPQMVAAVWVGYPNELRPMLNEFAGEPVAGSTLPAIIWRKFMTAALDRMEAQPETFTPPPYLGSQTLRVSRRGGITLDNGFCPDTLPIAFFPGSAPTRTAECFADEVLVPRLLDLSLGGAQAALREQPLEADVIRIPAAPGKQPGFVLRQRPQAGSYRSANSTIRVWVTYAKDGLLPNLVGTSLSTSRKLLRAKGIRPLVQYEEGPSGTVLAQTPAGGVASGSDLAVTLTVGRVRSTASP